MAKVYFEVTIGNLGAVAEDTNFGIKSSVVRSFLQGNGVQLATPSDTEVSRSKLAKRVTESTFYLSCWMTYAQIEKLKSKKVMFQDLQ